MRPDGSLGGALRVAVAGGFVVAAGCAALLVVGRGDDGGTASPRDTGCDRLCAAAVPPSGASAAASPANAAQHQGQTTPGPGSQSPSTRMPSSSAPPSASAGAPVVSFTVTSLWLGGYHAEVVLNNATQTPIDGWKLTFRVGGTATLHDSSAANTAMDLRTLTATPQDWDTTIAAAGTVRMTFGFDGAWAAPSECSFNGQPCKLDVAVH